MKNVVLAPTLLLVVLAGCGMPSDRPASNAAAGSPTPVTCFGADRLRSGPSNDTVVVERMLMRSRLLSPFAEGQICGPFRGANLSTDFPELREGYDADGRSMVSRECSRQSDPGRWRQAVRDPSHRLVEIRVFDCSSASRMVERYAVEWASPSVATLLPYNDDGTLNRSGGPRETASYANGVASWRIERRRGIPDFSAETVIRDGRAVSYSTNNGFRQTSDLPTPGRNRVTVTFGPLAANPTIRTNVVTRRDDFGNATVIEPIEEKTELGVRTERAFPIRINTYSRDMPTGP